MSNNFGALPGQTLSLGEATFTHHTPPPVLGGQGPTPTPATPPPRDPSLPGWAPSRRDGYDTIVILRLLFTSRKSRQSSSFSLPRRGTVRGRDPQSPGTEGCGAIPQLPRGCRLPPRTHLISLWARSRSPWDRLWLAEARKSWRYTEQSCRFTLATACSSLSREDTDGTEFGPWAPSIAGTAMLPRGLGKVPACPRDSPWPPCTHSRELPGSLRENILFLKSTQVFCN